MDMVIIKELFLETEKDISIQLIAWIGGNLVNSLDKIYLNIKVTIRKN